MFRRELSSGSIQNRPGCLIGFGVFWVGFSSIFVVVGISQGDTVFTAFGALFVAIGLGLLAYALLSLYTRYRIGQPEIDLSETTLRVGERFTVSYRHAFPRAIEIDQILVRLVFRETAVYQRGTDTKTVRHEEEIARYEAPGGHFQPGHIIEENYDLQIPLSGMHTLKVRRNRLQWFLRFEMAVPKLPDFVNEIELDVVPALTTG